MSPDTKILGIDLQSLIISGMRGVGNEEDWKQRTGIYWEKLRSTHHHFQSVKRYHMHFGNSPSTFSDSDRYKGLYEIADDFFFWYKLNRCHAKRKKVDL